MKKILFTILSLVFLSSIFYSQDIGGSFTTVVSPPTYEVMLSTQMVSGSGAAAIIKLEFSYNGADLSFPAIPVAGVDYLVQPAFAGYSVKNVTLPAPNTIRIAFNTFGAAAPLTTTPTDVIKFIFTITNTGGMSNLVWNLPIIEVAPSFGAPVYSVSPGNWPNTNDIPLPVELSSFSVNSVEGTKAQLNWETATEVNNHGFEIERAIVSEDAAEERNWEKVSFVEGHGNSNSIKTYTFTDKNLVGGSKFVYRLKQIDIDGTFEYSDAVEIELLPNKYELFQNYPNPFNPETNIKFSLPEDAKIAINIYNLLGEKVTTLLNEELKAGFHQINFNTTSAGYRLASGVYIYTINAKNYSQVKKMILMK